MGKSVIWRSLAVLALVLVILGDASAQPQGGRQRGPGGPGGPGGFGGFGGGAGDPLALLSQEAVKKHLKLDKDQEAYVKLFADQVREDDAKVFQGGQDGSREERMEKMRKHFSERTTKIEKELTEIIGADKFKRLKQIGYQATGVTGAMRNQEIRKQLNITEEQTEKLGSEMREAMSGMREMFQGGQDGDREAMAKKMADMRADAEKRVMTLLTDEQKNKWKEMIGDPIDFKLETPQFGRGFGGPGGPGGPGGQGGRRRRPDGEQRRPESKEEKKG